MDDKSIDVVSIATPNHWHALAAVWACQAGKDVYVEKPVSHNVSEGPEDRRGRAEVRPDRPDRHAEPQHRRACRRPSSSSARASSARSTWPRGSATSRAGRSGTRPTPRCPRASTTTSGSARRPSGRSTPTGSTTTGTGSGTTATATSATRASTRWTSPAGASARTSCRRTSVSSGGRFGYKDDGETPNTQVAAFEYDDCLLQFEVRGLPTNDEQGVQDRQPLLRHRRVPGDQRRRLGRAYLGRKGKETRPRRQGRRRPLRQLRQGRPGPQARAAQRRHRRRPPLQRPLPPRQHRLPARPRR